MREQNHEHGVNLIGFHHAMLGLGQTARLVKRSLEHAQIPHQTVTYRNTDSREMFVTQPEAQPRFNTNLFCLNADHLPRFARQVGAAFFADKRNIGICFWETDTLPEEHRQGLALLDEIWAASDFVKNTFENATDKPVHLFPHPVETPKPSKSHFNFGTRRVYLTSFDFLSDTQRKNPTGVIEAFCEAFPLPGGISARDPLLVIKSINAALRPIDALTLKQKIATRPDIQWIDGYLSPEENTALTQRADVLISLHRSEGFGLNLAEAMSLGTPVIATRYSGNLAFMNDANSFLTQAHRTKVGPLSEHYPAKHHWSEPDIQQAADQIRILASAKGKKEAQHRAEIAQENIHMRHSPQATAAFLIDHLSQRRFTQAEKTIPQTPHTSAKQLLAEKLQPTARPNRKAIGTFFSDTRKLAKHLLKAIKQSDQRQRKENQQLRAEVAKLTKIVAGLTEQQPIPPTSPEPNPTALSSTHSR